MSLQVLLTFPGAMTLGEFSEHLGTLNGMGCTIVHLKDEIAKRLGKVSKGEKIAAGRAFNEAFEFAEALSPNEESIIDQAMEKIYQDISSPLLDSMEKSGRVKTTMTSEIVSYFHENPGHTRDQAASALANKFEHRYKDINDAFGRIRALINVLASAKNHQKKLEKRGRGKTSQWYVLQEAA